MIVNRIPNESSLSEFGVLLFFVSDIDQKELKPSKHGNFCAVDVSLSKVSMKDRLGSRLV